MSQIKRYLEDVAYTCATAAYCECYEFGNSADFCEYEQAAFDSLTSGDQMQIDRLFEHLLGWFTDLSAEQAVKEMPLTHKALIALYPLVSADCLDNNQLTSDPASLLQ